MQSKIKSNVPAGIIGGLILASFYCVYVVILYVARGPSPFENQGTSLPNVLILYAITGAVGGAIVGALRPITVTRLGALAVGVIAALPLSLGVQAIVAGHPAHWTAFNWSLAVLMGIGIGWAISGALYNGPR